MRDDGERVAASPSDEWNALMSTFHRWGIILVKTLRYALAGSVSISYEHAVPGLIDDVERELRIFQTVAIMEVGQV